jgi:hypothetical protein
MSPVLFLFLLTIWVQIPTVVGLPAENVVDALLLARDGNVGELPTGSLPTSMTYPQVPLMTNVPPDTIGVSRRAKSGE